MAPKPIVWIGSAKEDLRDLPDNVQDVFGYALFLAQTGKRHPDAKPLRAPNKMSFHASKKRQQINAQPSVRKAS